MDNISSVGIVRALVYHIQSEKNPVFRAERRLRAGRGAYLGIFINLAVFALLIGGALFGFVESQFSLYPIRDNVFGVGLIIASFALSVTWTAPVAALAGGNVVRTTEVYDVLRVTPLNPREILLAKAAAAIRPVWLMVVGMAVFSIFVAVILGGPASALRAHDPALSGIILVAGLVVTVIERVQEIALAATVGIAAPTVSRSLSFVIGVLGGVLIRVIPLLIILVILPSLAFVEPIFAQLPQPALIGLWFALCSVAGSIVLLAAIPGVQTLVIVGLLVAVREVIIRALFVWVERRFRE